MFKKLLSNLPFNPSLINQVSFYTHRMKQEAAIRRMSVVFIVMAMLVQFSAVAFPPQQTLAASGNDIIPGGVTSQSEAVNWCRTNLEIETIYKNFGASCDAIAAGSVVDVNSRDQNSQLYSLGRIPYQKQGEVEVKIGDQSFYMRPLWAWDSGASSTYKAIRGTRSNGQYFWILFNCGNIVIIGAPEQPAIGSLDDVNCSSIWGWAFDKSLQSASITVQINIDNAGFATVTANGSRTDVGAAYPGVGNNHGYTLSSPSSIKDGRSHKIDAWANEIDSSGNRINGVQTFIGTKTVTVGTCKTTPPVQPPVQPPTTPKKCPLDTSILQSDERCTPCKYNPNILNDENCKAPKCPQDASISIEDARCKVCPADNSITKSNPKCDRCPYAGLTSISIKDVACKERCPYNVTLAKDDSACRPCVKSTTQTDTTACIELSKKATNTTTKVQDANGTTAHAGDVIDYTLSAHNTGSATVGKFVIQENVADILDYADITDLHGGTWNKQTNIVSWPKKDIAAGTTNTALLTVKIKSPIPQTPISTSNPGTGDLTMTNVYGNAVNIKLPPTIVKTTEQLTTKALPNTGPGTSLMMGFALTTILAYFFARTKLFATELDIVRHDFAATGGY